MDNLEETKSNSDVSEIDDKARDTDERSAEDEGEDNAETLSAEDSELDPTEDSELDPTEESELDPTEDSELDPTEDSELDPTELGEEATDAAVNDVEAENNPTDNSANDAADSDEPETDGPEDVMSGKERNKAFEKAESYFSKSRLDQALKTYLRCIKGIERGSGFMYLPQCLHQIAECYHLKNEDDRAIEFLKAEKIYYETALIDTRQMQEKIEEITGGEGEGKVSEELESEILRAVEYENLAKLCLEKHQYQLALEFSGKATKLYQKHYGDEHPATQRCLDLFTSVYAEVGKEEYTSKLSAYEADPVEAGSVVSGEDNTTGVRKRRQQGASATGDRETYHSEEHVTEDTTTQSQESVERYEEPSACCLALLWITLIVCALTAVVLFSVVYCKLTPTSWTCHYIRVQYRALSEHLGFIAYKLSKK